MNGHNVLLNTIYVELSPPSAGGAVSMMSRSARSRRSAYKRIASSSAENRSKVATNMRSGAALRQPADGDDRGYCCSPRILLLNKSRRWRQRRERRRILIDLFSSIMGRDLLGREFTYPLDRLLQHVTCRSSHYGSATFIKTVTVSPEHT